jgi:hypothetical protein
VAVTEPVYCTREQVLASLDTAPSVRQYAQLDRLIAAASRDVDALTRRSFWPRAASRLFDWPDPQGSPSWRLWVDQPEALISVSGLAAGGTLLDPSSYTLYPDDGPPYSRIELLRDHDGTLTGAATSQRAIEVVGWWGYRDNATGAGELAADVDDTATVLDVSDAALIGVGDLICVDTERMQVTGRRALPTGTTLAAALGAEKSGTTVAVVDGTAVQPGETILVDAERLAVDDIAGDTLIVRRAVEGSVLAAHLPGAVVWAPRRLLVERAAVGTPAAAHLTGAAVTRWVPPAPVNSLAIEETIVKIGREQSGMARMVGAGDAMRAAPGGDIRDVRAQVKALYRRVRTGAI